MKPPKGIKKKYLNTGIRPIAQQSQEVIKSDSESEAYYLSSENSTQQETESCLDNCNNYPRIGQETQPKICK